MGRGGARLSRNAGSPPAEPAETATAAGRAKEAAVAASGGVPTYSGGRGGSETCHFCGKRVYVVERMSAEGRFFHRSCFRCDYCGILLRLDDLSLVSVKDAHQI